MSGRSVAQSPTTTTAGGRARSGFRRDALTVAFYGSFVTWGWFLYGFSPAVPLIAAELGITRAVAGLHGTAMAVGTVATGFMAPWLARRYGRRIQSLVGGGFIVLGVALLLSGHSLAVSLPAVFLAAVGGNFTISAAQPALSVHHGVAGPAAVTEGNAMGAAFGLLAPLSVGASVAQGWGWRPAVAVVIVLAVATALLMLRLTSDGALGRGTTTRAADVEGAPAPASGRSTRSFSATFWFFWVALVCGVAIEFATTFWASDLLASRTHAPESLATASVSALVIGMCVCRFIVGPMAVHRPPERLLLLGYVVAGVGWAVFWLATVPWLAVAGLVIAGLGYGTHYPLSVSLVIRSSDGRPDQAQGRSSLGTGGAVALAPFVLGSLADHYGAHTAFLLVPGLILVGGTAVVLGLRSVRRDVVQEAALR
ncbi:MAG TPA: MFS transporter [Actinotalea sp.]